MIRAGAGTLALLVLSQGLPAQTGSRLWRAEDKVVLTDFSYVDAVAASDAMLYVVTPLGIAVYDRLLQRWQPPVSFLDGYPRERARVALVDPIDRSLWIGSDRGVVHYLPELRTFETVPIAGGVRQLMFDETDAFAGLYIFSARRWELLPRGSAFPVPAHSLPPRDRQRRTVTVPTVEDRHPFIATMQGLVLTDERLRRYRITTAAEVERTNDVFLGTDGYGVFRVDVLTAGFERMAFGLLDAGAAAVASVSGGVWVGTSEGSARAAITFVSSDLQRFEHEEGPPGAGFGRPGVSDVLQVGEEIWAATDAGVWRVALGREWIRLTVRDGLPSDRVYALAAGPNGVWVGTSRGLALVSPHETVRRVGTPGLGVRGLATVGDTLWVASARGLGASWVGMDRVVVPHDVAAEPVLTDETIAVIVHGDTVVTATRERLVWRGPAAQWRVGRVLSPQLGDLTALADDSTGVWVGADRGLAFFRFDTGDYVVLTAPGDLPGPVRDLAVDERHVWVATDGGLVRLTRSSVLP